MLGKMTLKIYNDMLDETLEEFNPWFTEHDPILSAEEPANPGQSTKG
jgi:hypothetical protein